MKNEELTTAMHYELLKDQGVNQKEFMILAVEGAIKRGVPRDQALKQYGVSLVDYMLNIDRILHDTSWLDKKDEEPRIPYEEMETIFDHNVTKEELKDITGSDRWTRNDLSDWSQINHYGLLYTLYRHRGDKETAKRYADKIPNTMGKVFGLCYHDFIFK